MRVARGLRALIQAAGRGGMKLGELAKVYELLETIEAAAGRAPHPAHSQ